MIAIVDAGPLYAAVDANDANHDRALEVLALDDLDFIVPSMIVAEVAYLLGKRMGAYAEAGFLRGMIQYEVASPLKREWSLISGLVERYSDFPLGGADASIVVLAERLGTDLLITTDRRHFGALRMSDGRPFRLLPE